MDIVDTGYERVEWVLLAQNAEEWWTNNDINISLRQKKQIKLSRSKKLRK